MPRVTSAPSSSAYRRLQQQQQQQLEASSSSSSRKYGKAAALKDAAVMSDNTESENESDAGDYAFLYDLDEPMDYHFQRGQKVWIRTQGGAWREGKVIIKLSKKAPTMKGEGDMYTVQFDRNIRKAVAPLNGEVKPDLPEVRVLLEAAGWL